MTMADDNSVGDGTVEIVARIPHPTTRVQITIDITPSPAQPDRDDAIPTKVSIVRADATPTYAMRQTGKKLLFVTASARLTENIGQAEAAAALAAIRAGGHTVLDVKTPADPYTEIRAVLSASSPGYDGVVVLGGYDVLPSARMDVLGPALRQQIGSQTGDADDFVVWNDQLYGDVDGDDMGEFPVSRIPDGRSATLIRTALTCADPDSAPAFGLRNFARPFAAAVFDVIGQQGATPLISFPQTATALASKQITGPYHYIMLHGSDSDATRFWGEDSEGRLIEALDVRNVPEVAGGVVLSGCCWGALTVRVPANRHKPGDVIQALTPEQSIALSFLKAGVTAFVGCTGSHYSPTSDAPDSFGGPMHVAFWKRILAGEGPSAALFGAKQDYAAGFPHGMVKPSERAIESKILREFTCLGLGW